MLAEAEVVWSAQRNWPKAKELSYKSFVRALISWASHDPCDCIDHNDLSMYMY